MYDLPALLVLTRTRRGLGVREAGRHIGCAASTVMALESGAGCSVRTLVRVLQWIEGD